VASNDQHNTQAMVWEMKLQAQHTNLFIFRSVDNGQHSYDRVLESMVTA
jgi:hypothetical protein